MYKKVLIATDGSPTAGKAADVGVRLARGVGAEAILLYVGDPAEGGAVLDKAAETLGNGVKISKKSVQGNPADKICEVAEYEKTDLIVIGNKGMTDTKRFLLGSVPNSVSHHAPCNVLIVKTT
jgi:nucleotide-binding universal stress UspA family protein